MNKISKQFSAGILITLLFSFCTSVKQPAKSGRNNIIMLSCRLETNNASGKPSIQVLSMIETSGTLKNDPVHSVFSEQYLVVYIINNKQVTDSIYMEHPANTRASVASASSVPVEKTGTPADFMLRFQSSSSKLSLRFVEHRGGKRKSIGTIKI